MSIEINASKELNSRKAQKILMKMLELNAASDYDFFEDSCVEIGVDTTQKYNCVYCYLEYAPSIGICMDLESEVFWIIWVSGLDNIEFRRKLEGINSLDILEQKLGELSDLDEIREKRGYSDKQNIKTFIKQCIDLNWKQVKGQENAL